MNNKAFYLTNTAGGFDVFSASGDLVINVTEESKAALMVDCLNDPDNVMVTANKALVGIYSSVEEAREVARQLRYLNEAVGPSRGSTLH